VTADAVYPNHHDRLSGSQSQSSNVEHVFYPVRSDLIPGRPSSLIFYLSRRKVQIKGADRL